MRKLEAIDPEQLGLEVTGMSGSEAHCKCPFHEDSSQSASFNVLKGTFYCFVCAEGMSAYRIAKLLGTSIVRVAFDSLEYAEAKKTVIDWSWILKAKPAYGNLYLQSRQVSNTAVEEFDIREYSKGILFPLRSKTGVTVGAIARHYKGDVRYVYYGDRVPLYPMDKLGASPDIVLVEGVFGVLRAYKYGVHAASILSSENARKAAKYVSGFRKKVCVFDNDDAGHHAAHALLKAGIGASAYWPGAEADEEDEMFWSNIFTSTQLTTSFSQFL